MILPWFASVMLAAAVAGGDPCPHHVIRTVAARAEAALAIQCAGSIRVEYGGIEWRPKGDECPAFVIVTPGHDTYELRPGSQTYVIAKNTFAIRAFRFRCVHRYFLFFAIGVSCEADGAENVGAVTHYEMRPCAELPQPDRVGNRP